MLCNRPGRRAQTTVRFLALRPAEVIPPEISGLGFNFGHALLGTTEFEVIQFVFHFYGFETYNMLVNPNNRLVKKVLMRMVESGDYFFFAINPNQSVTAFRSEIGQKNLAGLSTNLRQIQRSTTTDTQYRRALAQFRRRPDPPGQVLNWVCRDNLSYLDLSLPIRDRRWRCATKAARSNTSANATRS